MKPYSYGTHAAHVAVDPRTGRVKLIDFIAVEDIGRVLNPLIAHGQALGAIVQGLGGTFMEQLQYDEEGQILTASFADYLLPTATDFPNIRGKFVGLAPAPGNPLGVKGAGEGGTRRCGCRGVQRGVRGTLVVQCPDHLSAYLSSTAVADDPRLENQSPMNGDMRCANR